MKVISGESPLFSNPGDSWGGYPIPSALCTVIESGSHFPYQDSSPYLILNHQKQGKVITQVNYLFSILSFIFIILVSFLLLSWRWDDEAGINSHTLYGQCFCFRYTKLSALQQCTGDLHIQILVKFNCLFEKFSVVSWHYVILSSTQFSLMLIKYPQKMIKWKL